MTGCGQSVVAPAVPATIGVARSQHVPAAVTSAASALQTDYERSDWPAVARRLADPASRRSLLEEMQRWKLSDVTSLHISIVFSRALSRGQWVETLQFAADPRAVPAYAVYKFAVRHGVARVVGSAFGVSGKTFDVAHWAVTRSRHFEIFHGPYQLSGIDRLALRGLEAQRTAIIHDFHITPPPLIRYYLYPSVDLMSTMTRGTHEECGQHSDNVACAFPYLNPPSIQSALWPSYHEPIHVYQVELEPKNYVAPLFIAEGMAVALEDRSADPRLSDYCSYLAYRPLDDCARIAIGDVQPLALLSDRGFSRADPGDAYAMGGSFVKYLILHGGYRRFGKFYYALAAQPRDRVRDYTVAARRVYNKSIQQLIRAWTVSIS